MIWRYEWPFKEGEHVFSVRAHDGQGHLQIMQADQPFPADATGIDSRQASILPVKL